MMDKQNILIGLVIVAIIGIASLFFVGGGTTAVDTEKLSGVTGSDVAKLNWVGFPRLVGDDNNTGTSTGISARHCSWAPGDDYCNITNDTGVNWVGRLTYIREGNGTTTNLVVGAGTSTSLILSDSDYPYGLATSSAINNHLFKDTIATTSYAGGAPSPYVLTATTTPGSGVSGVAQTGGLIHLKDGEGINCWSAINFDPSLIGFYGAATTSDLALYQTCIFEILATSTPTVNF